MNTARMMSIVRGLPVPVRKGAYYVLIFTAAALCAIPYLLMGMLQGACQGVSDWWGELADSWRDPPKF